MGFKKGRLVLVVLHVLLLLECRRAIYIHLSALLFLLLFIYAPKRIIVCSRIPLILRVAGFSQSSGQGMGMQEPETKKQRRIHNRETRISSR